jgi:hypothetical protein
MEPNYGYKHTKGFLVFILIVVIMAIGAVYAQTSPNTPSGYSIDSTTGNLIPNGALTSATGITTTTGGPTWTAYPSPQGAFGVDGYTFSYPTESVGWAGVSLSSFNHGYMNSSAVFVTGFNYGLTYRFPCANSVGTNCDGTAQAGYGANPVQDNLRVEVGYYPATGSPTFYTHQLGLKNINDGNPAYNPNWQTLNQTVTFAGAKPLAQAGAVNMEIIGSDAGGWACLNGECYGPQVKSAYIRANYSVDPCILNPAYSPNCPGFNNVLQGAQSPTYWWSYNIAQTLPHIGGGVVLHGFEYGFNWTNYGSCYNTFMFWCTDWRTDGGSGINFRVSDKNNNTLYYDRQYREGNNASGSYYNRFLFTESRNSLDMGAVQWWGDSGWNNLAWAGWSRPIWTPDPCYTNGLYSPNCTNFRDTLNQVLADVRAQQERIAALSPSTSSTAPAPGGAVTTTVIADPVNPSVTVSTAAPMPQTTPGTTAPMSSNQASSGSTTVNFALSLIDRNRQATTMIQQQAVRTAIGTADAAAAQSQQEASQIAQMAVAASITAGTTQTQPGMTSDTQVVMARTGPAMSSRPMNSSSASLPQPPTTTAVFQSPRTTESMATTSTSLGIEILPPPAPPPPQPVVVAAPPPTVAVPVPTAIVTGPDAVAATVIPDVAVPQQIQTIPISAPLTDTASVQTFSPVTNISPPIIEPVITPPVTEFIQPTSVVAAVVLPDPPRPSVPDPVPTTSMPTNPAVNTGSQMIESAAAYVPPAMSSDAIVAVAPVVLPRLNAMSVMPKEEPVATVNIPTPPAPVVAANTPSQPPTTVSTETVAMTATSAVSENKIDQPIVANQTMPELAPPTVAAAVTESVPVPLAQTAPPVIAIAENTESTSRNFTTDRSNPITAIVENQTKPIGETRTDPPVQTVNKSVANNELAGGVSIESIAVTPPAFSLYASLVLRDAAFYAPREIYRGQRTVDNVRALRSLGQDARHQEMIDQQYRR